MPKNRYGVTINSVAYDNNILSINIKEFEKKPTIANINLSGVSTSDWTNIAEGKTVEIIFYNSSGSAISPDSFIGILKKVRHISNDETALEVRDQSIVLSRIPTVTPDTDQFFYKQENQTIDTLVDNLRSTNLDGNSPFLVNKGTIDDSSDVLGKFETFFSDRWKSLVNLGVKTEKITYMDHGGSLNIVTRRGSDTKVSSTSTSVGSGFLTDTAQSWETNEWASFVLRDSGANDFIIISNDSDTLTVSGTPTSGAYSVIRGYFLSGLNKNAFYGDRTFTGENIWNDIQTINPNGTTIRYTDLSPVRTNLRSNDTRLSKDFDATLSAGVPTDTTISVETTEGIIDEPGVVLIFDGVPSFSGTAGFVISKITAYYYYAGVTGNTLTGIKFLYATSEIGAAGLDGVYPKGRRVYFIRKMKVDSTTGFASQNANISIGSEIIPYAYTDATHFQIGEAGNGTAALNSFTDGTQSWPTDCWTGYVLVVDGTGVGRFPIISNTGTVLTVSGTPITGDYIIVPGFSLAGSGIVAISFFRNPNISTISTSDFDTEDTTIAVSSTTGFTSIGKLKIFNRSANVEVVSYTGKDATNFTGLTRGINSSDNIVTAESGVAVQQYVESNIHPTEVIVQNYPSGGIAESGSSIDTHGRRVRTFQLNENLSIEEQERLTSRILRNHRNGDQYISLASYFVRDYDKIDIGDLVEITDSTLDLNKLADNVTQKEMVWNAETGEFYTRLWVGNPPPSEFDKLMEKFNELIKGANANKSQYVTGDDPKELLVQRCSASGAKLNTDGIDGTQPKNIGWYATNNMWIQDTSSGPMEMKGTPFYCYGIEMTTKQEIINDYTWSAGTPVHQLTLFTFSGTSIDNTGNYSFAHVSTHDGSSDETKGVWWAICTGSGSGVNNGYQANVSGSSTANYAFRSLNGDARLKATYPDATTTYDLGTTSLRWDNFYATTAIVGAADSYVKISRLSANISQVEVDGTSSNITMTLEAKGTGIVQSNSDLHSLTIVTAADTLRSANGVYVGTLSIDATRHLNDVSSGSFPVTLYWGNRTVDTSVSDKRMKKNIESTKTNPFDIFNKMRIVDFEWKKGKKGKYTGLIAQEVDKYLPQFVKKPADPKQIGWAVEYNNLVPYLILAIKMQQKQLNKLEKKIEKL